MNRAEAGPGPRPPPAARRRVRPSDLPGDGVARPLLTLALATLALLALSEPRLLPAQDGAVTWDLPAFQSPYSERGMGLHLTMPDRMEGTGAVAAWRFPAEVVELGARGGITVVEGELGLLAGGDVRGTLLRAADDLPLDVSGVVGAGFGWMPQLDFALLRMPLGVSAGRRMDVGGGKLALYAHPRLALDARFSREAEPATAGGQDRFRRGDRLTLHGDVDLGLDVETAGGVRFRAAVTLGHNEAVGVGVLLR